MGSSSYSPLPNRNLLASTLGLFLFGEIISYKVLPVLCIDDSRFSYIFCTHDPPVDTNRASVPVVHPRNTLYANSSPVAS